ncbi:MAG: type III effector [Gammaproteobacteria bacterium]|nr:MAG: type III effector [Gammaproteobacteria bacterium]RLA53782.1 MAG: type III effector [Gammaproteobacteria bacterium]
MTIEQLIEQIRSRAQSIEFDDVMEVINTSYRYVETRFTNGVDDDLVVNEAGSNAGSCRIFAFGQLNGLNEAEILACFGRYYRNDVLANPMGTDHANIRTFMRHGLPGLCFDGQALQAR